MRGLDQLYLLEAIPSEMLTDSGEKRIRELRHKFPTYKAFEEEPTVESGTVDSPIPKDVARKMSDKNWLSAMQRYKGDVSHRDFLKGGKRELSSVLMALVKNPPSGFILSFRRFLMM